MNNRMSVKMAEKPVDPRTASGHPAQRVVAYGSDGVGKTTFAAGFPRPVFICSELGLKERVAAEYGVAVLPQPKSYGDVVDLAWSAAKEEHDFETIVIDTIDWVEGILFQSICEKYRAQSIEEVGGGYQKGYTHAIEEWRRLLAALDACWKRGMHVVGLAHAKQYTINNPSGDDYDTYDLKLWQGRNANAASLWREWADDVLFMTFTVKSARLPGEKKSKAVDMGDARFMRTVHNVAYEAKNRSSLPDPMPIDFKDYIKAVVSHEPESATDLDRAIRQKIPNLPERDRSTAYQILESIGPNPEKLAMLSSRISAILSQKGDHK